MSFVVDRRTGDPIANIPVKVWIDQKEVASTPTDQQGLVDTHDQGREAGECRRAGGQREAVRHQRARRLEPGRRSQSQPEGLHLHRSPGVSSRRHGSLQDHRALADRQRLHRSAGTGAAPGAARSADLRRYLDADVTLSQMGTANWNYPIPADAHLGSYYLNMQMGERYVEGTNFSVEEYKKPEYAVKVTAQTPRVLQGQPIKATIDARYYFGEPVANAKVKWVVHTSTYWPMGRSDDDDQARLTATVADNSDNGDEGDNLRRRSGGGEERHARRRRQAADHDSDQGRQQEAGPGLSHRSARHRRRQSRDRRPRIRAGDLRQLLPDRRAELLRLQQGQHRDHQRHRAGLRQEAGADRVPPGDESLELAHRRGTGRHHFARPDRRQRQGAGQADDSRLRRISACASSPPRPRSAMSRRTAYLWAPGESPWWSGTEQERIQIVRRQEESISRATPRTC